MNVHVYGDDMEKYVELEIIPAIQTNNTTLIVNEQSERQRIFSFLESISINVEIDDDGFVSEKAN